MTLTIYLVRHGQTLFNRRDLVQGWVDSPLTERGWQQARAAAAQLARRPLDAVYASTSERAVDTAETIAAHHPGLAVHRRRGLREMYFGDLEARPNAVFFQVVPDLPAFYSAVMAGRGPAVAGGEAPADYRARVDTALAEIVAAHRAGGEVVVVSHGITINMVLTAAGWTSPGPLENGSVSTVRYVSGGGAQVIAVGRTELSGPA